MTIDFNKRGVINLLTLSFVVVGLIITLYTSNQIVRQKKLTNNPKAVSCPITQCPGTFSCFNIGYYDTNSGMRCCAANTNCRNPSWNWATWGNSCNCTAPPSTPSPTRTPITITITPIPSIINCSPNITKQGSSNSTCSMDICPPDQYVPNSQQVVGTTRYCCCKNVAPKPCCRIDGLGVTPCQVNETKIRFVGNYTDDCSSANNSFGNVSLCSSIGGPTSGYICQAPPTPTPTQMPTPSKPPVPSSIPDSPSPSVIPSSTTQPTPSIPPLQTCSLGTDTYLIGQAYCDEPNNLVKQCLGNNRWQQIVPNPCGTSNCVNDPAGHAYSCSARCETLVDNGSNKLKVAFIPENYANSSEFRTNALIAIAQIRKTNLSGLVNKMNFYIVNDFGQSYHDPPYTPYDRVNFQKIHETGQNVCGADSSIVIDNPAKCGNGSGGLACGYGCGSAYACGPINSVVPHELGHSIAALNDEFGDANSPVGSTYNAPNCSDDSSCIKWSGMPGTGCYQGCGTGRDPIKGYSNWYRPSESGIMRTFNTFIFNPPSLKTWQDILKNY